MSETATYASLLPGNADVSAYLDGVEATIVSCRAATTDYDGKVTPAVPAIAVQFHVDSFAADKQPRIQHYSAGNPEHRIPSDDGKRFKVFGNKKGLPKDSNALQFVNSIVNAPHVSGQGGFPQDRIGDDLSVFEGMRVKLRSEAQDKTRMVEGQKKDDSKKERTIVLVDQIVALPWENTVKPATTAAPKATAKSAAPNPGTATPAAGGPMADNGARDAALDAVVQLLADDKNAGAVEKAKLGPLSFRILSQNPNRLNATKLLSQNASEFLPTIVGAPVMKGDAMVGTVAFDGTKVTLAPAA
jgi:hypothetical protein